MDFFGNLYRMALTGVLVAVICIVLYAVIGRIWSGKRRRMYGASLGNALQQLQAVARPSIQYQIEEKLKERKEEEARTTRVLTTGVYGKESTSKFGMEWVSGMMAKRNPN